MMSLLLVKVMAGMTAKGSMRDIRQLRRSFMLLRSVMFSKKAIMKVGRMAMVLVKRTLCHFFH